MNPRALNEEELFLQAIEIDEAEARSEFLDQACGDDRELRKRCGELVDMHYVRGRILDETREAKLNSAAVGQLPEVGSMIGPYKLLQEIGEGGMGVVFMAEQTEPVRRQVAVKVIKIGMDTRRVVARFESERQAMALMDHPGITKVLDAGATESGRPYFVMELVRGESINRYCDEKRLSLRRRLKLFVQVCQAVEHAHQKGIIHRDIKPSNIMVTNHDGVALPKIIDFGIAKATKDRLTDKTLFTNYGEMIGTPLYMSPEQAEMSEPDVDTRSDIYSLGVLLYELITGTTPFDDLKKSSLDQIREAIRGKDPQLASTRINQMGATVKEICSNRDTDVRNLHRFVRGELDWILMKCLARDRNQRYQSAGQLAQEICRHLNGEAVEAAAPTLRYRAGKFMQKHRVAVAVAAGFAFLLASGTLFSSMMAVKANQSAQRASEAEALANSRLDEVIKQRDRIAELERKQRNRAAMNQAAAVHNINMVKRFFDKPESWDGQNPPPKFQFAPMASVWKMPSPPVNPQASAPPAATAAGPRSGSLNQLSVVVGNDGAGDEVEVVMVYDDPQCRTELLKMVLKQQREVFGDQDVVVAHTLQQLGELFSDQENWRESEDCLRKAFEIFKHQGVNSDSLPEIRLKLAEALKKQGHLQQAMEELKDCEQTLEKMKIPRQFTKIMLDKVKKQLADMKREEK